MFLLLLLFALHITLFLPELILLSEAGLAPALGQVRSKHLLNPMHFWWCSMRSHEAGNKTNRTLPPSGQIWAVPPKLHSDWFLKRVWQVEKIIERSQSFKNFPSSSKRRESRLYSPLIRHYTVFFALYLVIQKTTYRTSTVRKQFKVQKSGTTRSYKISNLVSIYSFSIYLWYIFETWKELERTKMHK